MVRNPAQEMNMDNIEKFGITSSERSKCEVWTRVMGYHRPISSFNIGKRGEVDERRYFSAKKAAEAVKRTN